VKERELEVAYRKLKALRQDAYGGAAGKEEKKNVATGVGGRGRGVPVAAASGPGAEGGRGVARKQASGRGDQPAPAAGRAVSVKVFCLFFFIFFLPKNKRLLLLGFLLPQHLRRVGEAGDCQ
jgi:hypothetical protein